MELALGDTDLKLGKVLTAKSLHCPHWIGRDMGRRRKRERGRQEDISTLPTQVPASLPACLHDCLTVLGVEASGYWKPLSVVVKRSNSILAAPQRGGSDDRHS